MKLDPGVLTLVNVLFTGLNTLLLVGLLLREDAPRSPVVPDLDGAGTLVAGTTAMAGGASGGGAGGSAAGTLTPEVPATTTVSPTVATDAGQSAPAGGFSEVESVLASTRTPLASAAADLKKNVQMPSEAETAACVGSNDLKSPACGVVLTLLKRGYAETGMPFPSLPEHGASTPPSGATLSGVAPSGAPPSAPSGATAPGGTTLGTTPGATPTRSTGALRVYLDTLTARARSAASAAGDNAATVLPTPEALDAAVATGVLDSPESKRVIDQLRMAHQKYGLKFSEPAVAASSAGTAGTSQP